MLRFGETCSDVWFGNSGSDRKTAGRAGDAQIFIDSDQKDMSTSEGWLRQSGLENKLERQGWDGLDM